MAPRSKHPNTTPAQADHPHWRKFAREFRGDPRLSADVLYAIPKRLLEDLQRFAPDLLSEEDLMFERQLRELSATGFWRHQPFLSDVLDGHFFVEMFDINSNSSDGNEFLSTSVPDSRERVDRQAGKYIRDVLATVPSNAVIEEQRGQFQKRVQYEIRQRLKGYTGWLVTNSQYVVELQQFAQDHETQIQRHEDFPTVRQLSSSSMQPRAADVTVLDFRRAASTFLTRWALSGLTTWQLPEPVLPGCFTGDEIRENGIAPVGYSLFLPWSLLLDKTLTLAMFTQYYKQKVDLAHLAEWMGGGPPKWGFDRFAKMLDLYVYRYLALEQRYPDRLSRNTEAIDRVFASYWEPRGTDERKIDRGVASSSKIRLMLVKRMRACHAAIEVQFPHDEEGGRSDDSPAARKSGVPISTPAERPAKKKQTRC